MSAIESAPFGALPGDLTSSDESESTSPARPISPEIIPKGGRRFSASEAFSRSSTNTPDSPPQLYSQPLFARAGTILIFDWDDTLCPSSWLSAHDLTLEDNCIISPELRDQLTYMATLSRKTLEIADQLGTVVIVTNAEQGWIELSCRKFLPSLFEHLARYKQLSARTTYETATINCPFTWKQLAFRDEIYNHFHRTDVQKKNVISLGDSAHERLAIISITRALPENLSSPSTSALPAGGGGDPLICASFRKVLGDCRTKSVKFIERPNLEELMQEHELISRVLNEVVQYDDDLDLCIKSTTTPTGHSTKLK